MTADGDVPAELSKLHKSYELLGELSRDDMVTVYLARDRLSGKEVAIKVLRALGARGREALAHYASDARLLTALEHPNIVTVYTVKWLSEDVVAVVTERVRGPSLRQVLDVAGTLPVARATDVLRGLGRALAWAHSSQIMHRDVRPENVIFEDGTGRVVLSDFGLARRIEAAPGADQPAADAYRAPELADGRYPDRRTDVYSLGIVGWELLTGRRPWPDTMEPIAPGERAPAPPPLAEVRQGLPPALVAAIEGAVQLDRDRRIADVTTFMDRLRGVAPPAPEPEDQPADVMSSAVAPTEWFALPVPRFPQRRTPAGGEREVTPETRRETGEQSATREESAASALAAAEVGAEATAAAPVEQVSTRAAGAEREVAADVGVPPADSPATLSSREGVVATPAAPIEATTSQTPGSAPAPPSVQEDAKGRRFKAAVRPDAPFADSGITPASASPRETIRAEQPSKLAAELEGPADRVPPAASPSPAPRPSTSAGPAGAPREPSADRPRRDAPRIQASRPDEARGEPALTKPAPAEAGRVQPTRSEARASGDMFVEPVKPEQARSQSSGADVAAAAGIAGLAAAAAAIRPDTTHAGPARPEPARPPRAAPPRAEPPTSHAPPTAPHGPAASTNIPSDVELPPPEPVPLADMPPTPMRGPISGPLLGSTRVPGRFEPMRGGLGRPRAPQRGRRTPEVPSGPPMPPPLLPMWHTPAEFPLPTMPDPRPMPVDAVAGPDRSARRRWTRRGLGIGAAALVAIAAVVTLARMERAPDTTAGLIEPETPTGYGGDVVLRPRSGDSTALTAPATGRAGAGPASAAAAATKGVGASTSVVQPSDSVPSAAIRQAPPAASPASRPRPPPANPPATRAGARRSTTPAGSTTPDESTPSDPRGAASTPRPSAAAPAPRAVPGTPTRTAEARPTTPAETPPPAETSARCSSPALADQRACMMAYVARSDAGLNRVYGELVAAMRQRASTAPGDPDPPEVQRLRARQRAWIARRDAECRRRGRGREGPLWGVPRARCIEDLSAERMRELSATLARLRSD